MPPPKRAEIGDVLKFQTDNYKLTLDKKGEVIGLESGDNYFHIKPNDAKQIEVSLKKAEPVIITAKKRVENSGFLHFNGLIVYHAKSVA